MSTTDILGHNPIYYVDYRYPWPQSNILCRLQITLATIQYIMSTTDNLGHNPIYYVDYRYPWPQSNILCRLQITLATIQYIMSTTDILGHNPIYLNLNTKNTDTFFEVCVMSPGMTINLQTLLGKIHFILFPR